ncbi:hypothetical protein B0H13DRAFT_2350389 [Mycena leptocephala]|nr:hypothetical protein B0H13DRAFT_2350389 [Mycena leptocephala]
MAENQRTIAALFGCLERGNCSENQTKVVILAAGPFLGLLHGENGGEAIWANSTLIALQRLGYSYLYSINGEHPNQLYNMFRPLVSAILVDATDANSCFRNERCVLSERNPHGIPAWKIFSFHFWNSPDNPLGRKWTLSPEDYRGTHYIEMHQRADERGTAEWANNTYLGYSIEPQCARQPFIPHQDRPWKAYVLAKEAGGRGIQFMAGVRERVLPEFFPSNITNLGFSSTEFYTRLAESRVLVGVGTPVTSPTPYEALCLGVPFINPILHWDPDNPADKTRWEAQHTPLMHLDPPFVLEDMRMSAVEARLAAILATDWKAEAVKLLAERKASGSGETFWI